MTEAIPPEVTPDELAEERAETMRRATEIAIRLGVLAIVVGWCLQIIAPFVGIVAWGMIIAIASTSPYEFLVRRLGGKRGLAATLLVCLSLAIVVVPAVMLSSTLISGAQHFSTDMADGSIEIPPPPAHVAGGFEGRPPQAPRYRPTVPAGRPRPGPAPAAVPGTARSTGRLRP